MAQNNKANKSIGNNIRQNRHAKGLTQEMVAAKMQIAGCDISRSTLAKIEAGIRHISVEEINVLKDILQMKYEDFYENS